MSAISQWMSKVKDKIGIIGGFFEFLWTRKLWWLIPMFFILFAIGLVLVLSQGSAIAPFIYTLF